MHNRWELKREGLVCGLLLLAVALVYGQTFSHDFVLIDDGGFVYDNPHVLAGLTIEGFRWALTSGTYGEWTPLASLSHMLDCQLWGPSPGPQHALNVLLHAASTVVLFLSLLRMTGGFWPSAWVAAVFAVHPLHVESVAWISERRDVLSGFFFMLVLWTYARYVESPSAARYGAVAGLFALGLISKPIVVTTPLVLLLLDYWPLGRFAGGAAAARRLVREKLPLFFLSAVTCWIILLTHASRQVGAQIVPRPLPTRLVDALAGYGNYLLTSFYPARLAPYYLYSADGPSSLSVAIGLVALVLTAIACFRLRRTSPYIPVGCLWFLGMLVPVIGVLQNGNIAHADRYTYLSQIGLVIAIAWPVANARWWSHAPSDRAGRRWILAAVAWTPVLLLSIVAYRQASHWRDDESLWTHAIASDPTNLFPRFNRGRACLRAGRPTLAIRELREATAIRSIDVHLMSQTQSLLGRALTDQGKLDEGLLHYQLAIDLDPTSDIAHGNLARALDTVGKHSQAIVEWREAIRWIPLGPARSVPQAIASLTSAAHAALAASLLAGGNADEAISECELVLKDRPNQVEVVALLGNALVAAGRAAEAIPRFQQVLSIEPSNADVHVRLASALCDGGHVADALPHLDQAIRLEGNPTAIRQAAWLRATSPEAGVRDGVKAVELANRLVLSADSDPRSFDTLGAALAEAGDFEGAVTAAARAHDQALSAGDAPLAQSTRERLDLYGRHLPYRE
ncbi:MAG TPA: tetratricopeptide repeat protein [Pirellulales bacterium]|jgi:tetratricopeptide (TPR) repeat protein|nr:tetratricopeptide repeat protein [Pirellulales bacterium]